MNSNGNRNESPTSHDQVFLSSLQYAEYLDIMIERQKMAWTTLASAFFLLCTNIPDEMIPQMSTSPDGMRSVMLVATLATCTSVMALAWEVSRQYLFYRRHSIGPETAVRPVREILLDPGGWDRIFEEEGIDT